MRVSVLLVLVLFCLGGWTACDSGKQQTASTADTPTVVSAREDETGSPDTSDTQDAQTGDTQTTDGLPTPPPLPTGIPIPTFPPADLPAIGNEPPRRLDPEIKPLGVTVESPDLAPGERYWRAVAIQWHDPEEAAYRHYVWVRTRDKNGASTAGQPVIFKWPSGQSSAAAPVDFPMYAAGHSYAVWIDDGIPSEKVTGMGLGTPSSRHTTDHVEYFVTFQVAVRGGR